MEDDEFELEQFERNLHPLQRVGLMLIVLFSVALILVAVVSQF